MNETSIGVFDSGVGGLSVLGEIQRRLPGDSLVYFADQDHVPYGSRSLDEVRSLSQGIARFLLDQGCELIVVACNTASAAALHSLRAEFPDTPFVGMEPAVKPAAEHTETRKVAVLATQATFQGALFASVVDRFASGVEVIEIVAPGLVELIELGETDPKELDAVLEESLAQAMDRGIDALALACTHYSFVIPNIQRIVGSNVTIIDPAPAIAKQTERVRQSQIRVPHGTNTRASTRYITSGEPDALRSSLFKLIGKEENPEPASWEAGSIRLS